MDKPHVIQIVHDHDSCEFVLMAISEIEVMGKDCPDDLKESWFDEHGVRIEDDMVVPAAQVGNIRFERVEELALWLAMNLPKFWPWLAGLNDSLPTDISVSSD